MRRRAVLELRAPLPLVPKDRHRRIVDEGERATEIGEQRDDGAVGAPRAYQTPPSTFARGVERSWRSW